MTDTKICFKKGDKPCDEPEITEKEFIFVAMQYDKYRNLIFNHGIAEIIKKIGVKCIRADRQFENMDIFCKICRLIQEAKLVLIEISDNNLNVLVELGMAIGFGKRVILIREKDDCLGEKKKIPLDVSGIEYVSYETLDDILDVQSENGLYSILIKYIREDKIEKISYSVKSITNRNEKFKAIISPFPKIKKNDGFTTSTEYIGEIIGGFFDNCIKNEKGDIVKWNPDPNSYANRGPLEQGKLNGCVEVKSSWHCDTKDFKPGKYIVHVRLYDHPIKGERKRNIVQEKVMDIEII